MENKTTWVLDPTHSEIAFKVKHMMISNVKGIFKNAQATVTTHDNDFNTAEVVVQLDVDSIDTTNTDRDTHLKSSDFFDASNHQKIHFVSTSIHRIDDDHFKVNGDLTIKGITKPVVLDAELGGIGKDPWGNEKAGISFTGKINRKDWGLGWNVAIEAGGVLVSETVHLLGDIQLVKSVDNKQAAAESATAEAKA